MKRGSVVSLAPHHMGIASIYRQCTSLSIVDVSDIKPSSQSPRNPCKVYAQSRFFSAQSGMYFRLNRNLFVRVGYDTSETVAVIFGFLVCVLGLVTVSPS